MRHERNAYASGRLRTGDFVQLYLILPRGRNSFFNWKVTIHQFPNPLWDSLLVHGVVEVVDRVQTLD